MIKAIRPSINYQLRELRTRLRIFLTRMSFWQWEKLVFQFRETNTINIHYVGKVVHLPVLKALLGVPEAEELKVENIAAEGKISVYEYPVFNALRIPHCLSTVVKLDKSIEEILASYSRSLRRSTLKQAPKFRRAEVMTEVKVEDADKTMLKPYARARNGAGANQMAIGIVKELAFSHYGRLDLLYEDDKVVGCHLGNTYTRRGKRYWHVNRLGYTEEVFSDYARLQDINSANLHLALVTAIKGGYHYCDYGTSLARPGGGLIEWKRRRKGYLTKASSDSFYLKVPDIRAAQFFWDSPLFSLEGKKINLHLGVPANKTDEEVKTRYREMGYDGLAKVYLMCETQPSEAFIEMMRELYRALRFQPDILIKIAT